MTPFYKIISSRPGIHYDVRNSFVLICSRKVAKQCLIYVNLCVRNQLSFGVCHKVKFFFSSAISLCEGKWKRFTRLVKFILSNCIEIFLLYHFLQILVISNIPCCLVFMFTTIKLWNGWKTYELILRVWQQSGRKYVDGWKCVLREADARWNTYIR